MDRLNHINLAWLPLAAIAASAAGVLAGWLCSKPWRRP